MIWDQFRFLRLRFSQKVSKKIVCQKFQKTLKSATTGKWTPEYLRTVLSERTFSIHEAQSPKLDFRTKNFDYKLKSGDEFLSSCMGEGAPYMYLRALGANFRKDRFGV